MSNCCLGLFRGIWSFLIGSLRMILFFGCLVYILMHATWLAILYRADSDSGINLPGVSVRFRDYLHAFSLLILGLLGAYGAFYNHHSSIRSFALLSALNTLLLTLIVLYTMGPDDLREQNTQVFGQLQKMMPNYDWEHNDGLYDPNYNQATKSWDRLQRLACCGINGPDDWQKYRPDHEPLFEDAYPPTCCVQADIGGGYMMKPCKRPNLFETGCSDRIAQLEAASFIAHCVFIIYQLALSVIAYMVGSCNFESRVTRHATVMSAPMNRTIYVEQRYQQPPTNRDFVGAAPKYTLPPMYPDLRAAGYSAPPPSYGT